MDAKTAKKIRREQQKIVGGQMAGIFQAINKQRLRLRLRAAKDIIFKDLGFETFRGFEK